jgi:dTDP-4-amino-4,6-dideoxygalactose transaminase
MALGVGPGDAILTTPFTFISTAEVISLLGATPVFVDIDINTFNIDPQSLKTAILALLEANPKHYPLPQPERAGSGHLRPKAIIAVDLFGLPADYDEISKIACDHGIFLVQDAAQSFGGTYKGRYACAQGAIGCTSFFPAKPLGCYGDGGMCFTDNDALAADLRSIRVHGKGQHKYDNQRIGINGRLDTLQAAILNAKFDIFPEEIELRQQAAQRYDQLLAEAGAVSLPKVPSYATSVWAQYSLLAADGKARSHLQEALKQAGVPTAVYYPCPLHLQTAFGFLGYAQGAFPNSESASERIFSLPMHPYLKADDQEHIANVITQISR